MTAQTTTLSENTFVVVAGNGPSLAEIAPGRVLASDYMIRTNSFFLEPEFYLGPRVDLAMITSDPRMAPFMVETLDQAQAQYGVRCWAAFRPQIIKLARNLLKLPQEAIRFHPEAEAELIRLRQAHQSEPTLGVQALFLAHAMGATSIGVTGVDLYSGPKRYAFEPGPRMRALMGQDLGSRSYDQWMHHPDLDKAAIDWLAARSDVSLYRLSEETPLSAHLDLAPVREGEAPARPPKTQITDWSGWAQGWYPIQALWVMRKVRAFQRRVLGTR